jgi:hypothetical protein
MIVNIKAIDFPPGSPIGPEFNVITTPSGAVNPQTVTIEDLTNIDGINVDIANNVTNITLVSTGTCLNSINLVVPCTNPIVELIKYYFKSTSEPTLNDFGAVIDRGFYFNGCNVCSGNCQQPYVFSSVETFLKYAEAIGIFEYDLNSQTWTFNNPEGCCIKTGASVETYLKWAEATGGSNNEGIETIIPIQFYISDGDEDQTIILYPESTLHNGKPWYCFDKPTCQRVVYYANSGIHTGCWVYSESGLDGESISTLCLQIDLPGYHPEEVSWDLVSENYEYNIIYSRFNTVTDTNCPEDSSFIDCITSFHTILGVSVDSQEVLDIVDKGIVEFGQIGELGMLCEIINTIKEVAPNLTPVEIVDYVSYIQDKGIVSANDSTNILQAPPGECYGFLTSIETYLKYAEAVES